MTGVVDDEEVGTIVGCLNTQNAAQVLVDLANLRGGPDNITVTVVEVKRITARIYQVTRGPPQPPEQARFWIIQHSDSRSFFSAVLLGVLGLVMQWPFLILSGILYRGHWYGMHRTEQIIRRD